LTGPVSFLIFVFLDHIRGFSLKFVTFEFICLLSPMLSSIQEA
jgi:hypothetical protein